MQYFLQKQIFSNNKKSNNPFQMNSIYQHYCDVNESIAFSYDEHNSSTEYNNSSTQQFRSSPMLLKCFNCYNYANNDPISQCKHCDNTGKIMDTHPLALLLNDVLTKKLQLPLNNNFSAECFESHSNIRQSFNFLQQEVYPPINEQEEQFDDKKLLCDYCDLQCGLNYKYYCKICECYYICANCIQTNSYQFNHQHPLSLNFECSKQQKYFKSKCKINNVQSIQFDNTDLRVSHTTKIVLDNFMEDSGYSFFLKRMSNQIKEEQEESSQKIIDREVELIHRTIPQLRDTSFDDNNQSGLLESIGIDNKQSFDFLTEEPVRQSFGISRSEMQEAICNCCNQELRDLYCICQTCQIHMITYRVCSECYDDDRYVHDSTHKLQPILGNIFGRKSEFDPKISVKQPESDQQQHADDIKLAQESSSHEEIPHQDDYSPFLKPNSMKKSYSKLKCSLNLGVDLQQKAPQSKIHLQIEGLFNSEDINDELSSLKLKHKVSSQFEVNNSIQNIQLLKHSSKRGKKSQNLQKSDQYRFTFQGVKMTYFPSESEYSSESQDNTQQNYQININQSANFQPKIIINTKTPKHESRIKMKDSTFSISNSIQSLLIMQKSFQKSDIQQMSQQNKDNSSKSQSPDKQGIKKQSSKIDWTNQKTLPATTTQTLSPPHQFQIKQKLKQFIFYQYSCNSCGCDPIKNIRYRCLECNDFDLCVSCYNQNCQYSNHPHKFEQINGLKKLQSQKNVMLQKMDLNKNYIKSKNVSTNTLLYQSTYLINSKKNIDIIKKNVNQLNIGINMMTRSVTSKNINYQNNIRKLELY